MTLVCPFLVDTGMFNGCKIRFVVCTAYSFILMARHVSNFNEFIVLLQSLKQERNGTIVSTTKARVLCQTGHESHTNRPTNDLHATSHVHGHLHENVSECHNLNILVLIHPFIHPSSISYICSVLPFDAIVCMYRFIGADKCMYPFLAQRKESTNNNESKTGI